MKIRGLNAVTWMSEKLSLPATTPKITGDAIQFNHRICDTQPPRWPHLSHLLNAVLCIYILICNAYYTKVVLCDQKHVIKVMGCVF